jgi:hypothetical protein
VGIVSELKLVFDFACDSLPEHGRLASPRQSVKEERMQKSTALTAMHELGEWLISNGSATSPLQVARRLLRTAQERNWNHDPGTLVAWLEELALDVARAWQTDDPEEPSASNPVLLPPLSSCALGDLVDDRNARAVTTEDLRIASAFLGLAGDHEWISDPARMVDWLQRLASEVTMPTHGHE